MIVERRLHRSYPIGFLCLAALGVIFLAIMIAMGVYRSFELTESGSPFPIVGLVFLLISPGGFIIALQLIRTGHNENAERLSTFEGVIEIPFNRRPDIALLAMLLAFLPEILLWMTLVDGKARYFPGFLFGCIAFLASTALWSALTPRAPMIFDREGLQFAEFWRGKLLWQDLEASVPAEHFLILVLKTSGEVILRKRPWYKGNARWSKNGEALILPLPLRYLSLPSLQRAIRERTNLKPVSAGAVQRNET
ncbi:MAG: hypothetical protein JNL25_08590 [Rhodospirillaceae bacterium]|nr:hypothetical protein [Rhodospirillaceae bacterium]